MAHAHQHTLSSMRKFGGSTERDYEEHSKLHKWMDSSKQYVAGPAHRMLYHHTAGIFLAEEIFGAHITMASGQKIPVRYVLEQHLVEDFGWIPSPVDWMRCCTVPRKLHSRGPAEPVSIEVPIGKE